MIDTDHARTVFWSHVNKLDSGCWLWNGRLSSGGFPVMSSGGKRVKAHIFAYEVIGGKHHPWQLTRACGKIKCVNPDHIAPRQNRSLADRFWSKVCKSDGCWEWTGHTNLGYGRITVDTKTGPRPATHVSWFLHKGEWPPCKIHLCHTCDNPPCVNPAHLYIGTATENARDRESRGRGNQPVNEGNGKCKYSADLVCQVKAECGKMTARQAGDKFGIPHRTVWAWWTGYRRTYA